MSQERRALHEKHRKRRHADIGHDVTAVVPAPLVRQTRTGRPQPRYKVLDRSHTALESDSLQPAHCRIAPRFNLSHSPLNVALSAKMRIADEPIEMPRNSPTGFITAFFATITGFGLIWQIWWLVGLGLFFAYATFVWFAWRDVEEYVMPAPDDDGALAEAARRARAAAHGRCAHDERLQQELRHHQEPA